MDGIGGFVLFTGVVIAVFTLGVDVGSGSVESRCKDSKPIMVKDHVYRCIEVQPPKETK